MPFAIWGKSQLAVACGTVTRDKMAASLTTRSVTVPQATARCDTPQIDYNVSLKRNKTSPVLL